MTENATLLGKARQLAEARNHKLLPFVHRGRSTGRRCVTCGKQVYVMPDAELPLAGMPSLKRASEAKLVGQRDQGRARRGTQLRIDAVIWQAYSASH
jgi:hypothetical protein